MLNIKRRVLILLLAISGCVSKNIDESAADAFVIESKAKITDKVNNESHTVDMMITYIPENKIRMHVTGLLGVQVADMTMTKNQIQCAVHVDKLFFDGPFKRETFKPVFKQPVDPRFFWAIINGKTIKDGLYQGTEIKTELLDKKDQFQTKRITLTNSHIEILWLIKDRKAIKFDTEESQNETFVLNKPSSYKYMNIK